MEKIGGLYIKKSKKGETFLSGKIRNEKVLVFKNKRKESERHPDYVVMIPSDAPMDDNAQDEPPF